MKKLLSLILFLQINFLALAQPNHPSYVDRLHYKLGLAKNEDSIRILALDSLADYYGFIQADSCLYYAALLSDLAQKINYKYGQFLGFRSKYYGYNCQGNYPKALEASLNMLKTSEQIIKEKPWTVPISYYTIGLIHREMKDYPNAITYLQKSIQFQEKLGEPMADVFFSYSQLGLIYNSLNQSDSSFQYARKGYDLGLHSTKFTKYFSLAYGALGNIYMARKEFMMAEDNFRAGIKQAGLFDNLYFQARNYNNLASLFDKTGLKDSCIYFALISLGICQEHNFADYKYEASSLLTRIYESENKTDSTLKYLKIMMAAKDSVYSQSKVLQYQQYAFNEIQRQQEITQAREKYQNKVKLYGLLAAVLVLLLLSFIFYRNNRQKQKDKIKIQKAYDELKSAQAMLVQSEKMASLGELTAGIAHEIQNPLNFVNNFSEVNKELLDELGQAIGDNNEAEAFTLISAIRENEKKINFHGARADSIVKGMLQHSRSSTGVKEPTDINALTEEYLRLSYQGLRAKNNSFVASTETSLEPITEKINLVPQDMGRVLLNLFNNAFYAATEKKKLKPEGFEPKIVVTTRKSSDGIEIIVRDNGMGIPKMVLEKVFQPFFTTKPTGLGTGLGLSISYDIIKAHGGEIKVETVEGEYTEFKIILPYA